LHLQDELGLRNENDADVTPLRELVRKWLTMVPAIWSAMFRPLVRPTWDNIGGGCIAWFVATVGGLPGSLAALDLVGHLWGIPASAVMLTALVVGAIIGASLGILVAFLPWFAILVLLEHWPIRDKETADATDTASGAENMSETDASADTKKEV